jgi:two-component system, chemotaxis family, CheB/CheR fusion protein
MPTDLGPILRGAQIAILITDRDLCLRFFSPNAGKWFGLTAADIGRNLAGLALPVADLALAEDAHAVLTASEPVRREFRSTDGTWLMRSVIPYQAGADRTEGVLAAFMDITALKAADAGTRRARRFAEAVIEAIREPLVVLDENMEIVFASRSFYRLLDTSPRQILRQPLAGSAGHHFSGPSLAEFIERLRAGARRIDDHAMEITLPTGEQRSLVLSAREIAGLHEGGRNIVVTIEDVTERVQAQRATELARQRAEQASLATTRFLASASHDLRQPLQTLRLLRALLAERATEPEVQKLVARCARALDSFSEMLDAILDINRLDTGAIHPRVVSFPVGDLFHRLHEDLVLQAEAAGLDWRVVPTSAIVQSDPRLLERMLRNLLSNAIKYTPRGRILLGCRRRGATLSIQVWDTGPGIPQSEQRAIFREFNQGASASRYIHAPGLGLGLSIVQRLAERLGHTIDVVSRVGRGSMFSIDVPLAQQAPAAGEAAPRAPHAHPPARLSGSILVVEEDRSVREALAMFAATRGLEPATASGGEEALGLVARRQLVPDMLAVGYGLSGPLDGLATIERLRAAAGRRIPALVLTGDISTASLRAIEASGLPYLAKPISAEALWDALAALAETPAPVSGSAAQDMPDGATIYIVEDNPDVRQMMRALLEAKGYGVEDYSTGEAFLAALPDAATGCAVLDFRLPGMDGIEILRGLAARGSRVRAIMVTGSGDVVTAVAAMKAGAVDFVEKPVDGEHLATAIARALHLAGQPAAREDEREAALRTIGNLTARQREILDLVVAGHANKEIASRLGINQRTVESHRALVMKKLDAKSLPDLVRRVLAAQ